MLDMEDPSLSEFGLRPDNRIRARRIEFNVLFGKGNMKEGLRK